GALGRGRLANRTHAMWKHLESFHIIHAPVYASKYPMAQGVILALGEVFGGHPWFGVWLSVGLMCGAICWMLQGWLPPGWALWGGFLAAIRFGLLGYWMNSYYGGAVPALGGALVLGALPRIKQELCTSDAIGMAAGAAILVNSRPYEGVLLCATCLAILACWIASGRGPALRRFLHRAVIPGASVLALVGCFMLLYHKRTTGYVWLTPYQLNRSTYGVEPMPFFIWQSILPSPEYRHLMMKKFY